MAFLRNPEESQDAFPSPPSPSPSVVPLSSPRLDRLLSGKNKLQKKMRQGSLVALKLLQIEFTTSPANSTVLPTFRSVFCTL
jgi:hypothetical protein